MHLEFTLPQKWLDPSNKDHVLFLANRIAAIRYGDWHVDSPPEIQADGTVNICPRANNHWLTPPTKDAGQEEGRWRLNARYDSSETLAMIVTLIRLFS